jgi:cyclopropane-fatty-acyl-phospholipid synthase
VTLGQFLEGRTYSQEFRSAYLVPLCAGIWLSSKEAILGASARTVLSFLRDHKMLQVSGHLPWMTVKGRSQAYVNKLVSVLESSGVEIRTSAPVSAVERTASGVAITANGSSTVFDKVIIAAHAPDALALLGDGATSAEKAILGAFSYVKSTVVLHRDASLMPADPAAWGAWNFVGSTTGASSITYWLNKLQNLDGVAPLFLTINPHTPPTHVLDNDPYPPMHWEPNSSSARAMADFASIQGQHNTWFAGAYQGYGFHEDGFKAGMAAAYDIMGQVYQPITAPAVDAPAVAYKACKPLAVFEGIAKMEATKA